MKFTNRLAGAAFVGTSLLLLASPTVSYAHTETLSSGQTTADVLARRGHALRKEIVATYRQLRSAGAIIVPR
jgi:hypothetical protein